MKKKQWKDSYNLALKATDPALRKIVLSQKFLDSSYGDNCFEEITKFIKENPYWPQIYLLKLRAESCIDTNTNKKLIVSWFKKHPPLTAKGHKYYALSASTVIKHPEDLKKIVKTAWHKGNFSLDDQKSYHKKFKQYLSTQDHIKKIDNSIWNQEITAAKNSLYLVDIHYQNSFKAQIALAQKKKNAKSLFKKVPKKYHTPGLIYQYITLCKTSLPSGAEIVALLRSVKGEQDYGDQFWKLQSYLAREFIEKKKYKSAYNIASIHFANSSSNKSDAEFLSGWLALSFLQKPILALNHFREFNRIVKTPLSKSRGIYWLARAHEGNNDKEKATKLYNLVASKYSYTFYGQVALVELKKGKISFPEDVKLNSFKASAHDYAMKNDIIRATKIVSKHGSNTLSQTYIQSSLDHSNESNVVNVAYNIHQLKNVHHVAWMAKHILQKHVFIKNHAYPTPYQIANSAIETPLIYSIIRQESVFDQQALSSAEAHGLMQVIKETACDTAKKISTHCHIPKLRLDTSYNIKIGSNYLKHMIEDYDGSYILAIASYNGGPHNVNKWIKRYGDPRKMKTTREVLDWIELIPFYETRNYVQRVLENLQIYRTIIDKNNEFYLADDLLNKKKT
ncbi:MAG: lytic transglycosylase domain-containing protein [Rickettsiaceae bacterium]|nr:lytic transglycosylase domain-containing protein [Rickettsiaceae bacterium]